MVARPHADRRVDATSGASAQSDHTAENVPVVRAMAIGNLSGTYYTDDVSDDVIADLKKCYVRWKALGYWWPRSDPFSALIARHDLPGLIIVDQSQQIAPQMSPAVTVELQPLLLDSGSSAFLEFYEGYVKDAEADAVNRSIARSGFHPALAMLLIPSIVLLGLAWFVGLPTGWFVALAALLSLTVGLGLFRHRLFWNQWYLANGGVLVRSWNPWRREYLRRYTRSDSVLVCGFGPLCWAALFRDGRRSLKVLSAAELRALLAAWRSPLPTPPLERFADFRDDG